MTIINLTPHKLNIQDLGGDFLVVPPSGTIARVAVSLKETAVLDPGIQIYSPTYGEVTDLPEPRDGVNLVVSGLVAAAAPRPDVFSPGELIRDEEGKPTGCRGLKASV